MYVFVAGHHDVHWYDTINLYDALDKFIVNYSSTATPEEAEEGLGFFCTGTIGFPLLVGQWCMENNYPLHLYLPFSSNKLSQSWDDHSKEILQKIIYYATEGNGTFIEMAKYHQPSYYWKAFSQVCEYIVEDNGKHNPLCLAYYRGGTGLCRDQLAKVNSYEIPILNILTGEYINKELPSEDQLAVERDRRRGGGDSKFSVKIPIPAELQEWSRREREGAQH